MKTNITFESWVAVDINIATKDTLAVVERKRMSVPWRIWEICLGRMNNWGHAAFTRGELVKLVCGADERSDRAAVKRGMKTLADMGRIMPVVPNGSTYLCVVINNELVQRGAGKGGRLSLCSEPEHREHRDHTWPTARAVEPADPFQQQPAAVTPPVVPLRLVDNRTCQHRGMAALVGTCCEGWQSRAAQQQAESA